MSTTRNEGFFPSLIADVTIEEIHHVINFLPNNKSPGPDGFTLEFFKATWDITGPLVISAVKEFFQTRSPFKEFNATLISLVPKCASPSKVIDYRPISCCNVVYRIISKVLANRFKSVYLPQLRELSVFLLKDDKSWRVFSWHKRWLGITI